MPQSTTPFGRPRVVFRFYRQVYQRIRSEILSGGSRRRSPAILADVGKRDGRCSNVGHGNAILILLKLCSGNGRIGRLFGLDVAVT